MISRKIFHVADIWFPGIYFSNYLEWEISENSSVPLTKLHKFSIFEFFAKFFSWKRFEASSPYGKHEIRIFSSFSAQNIFKRTSLDFQHTVDFPEWSLFWKIHSMWEIHIISGILGSFSDNLLEVISTNINSSVRRTSIFREDT